MSEQDKSSNEQPKTKALTDETVSRHFTVVPESEEDKKRTPLIKKDVDKAKEAYVKNHKRKKNISAKKRNRDRGQVGGVYSAVLKACIYVFVVLLLSGFLSFYIISAGNDVFAFVKPDKDYTITVTEDMTPKKVAELLAEKGIIEYETVFRTYMIFKADDDSEMTFVAGEHIVNSSMNYGEIIYELTVPKYTRTEVRITIPEGYTVEQIIGLLKEKGMTCTREELTDTINNYPFKHEFVRELTALGYPETRKYRLEGYLYPDTYDFYQDDDAVTIINKMLNNFDEKFWSDYEEDFKSLCVEMNMTFDEVITLASIIQAEGKLDSDFERISQVFHNRFDSSSFTKMESDATIQYFLTERTEDLTAEQLAIDNPYNTYKYDGLPPGAICNPGIDAIWAALAPDIGDDIIEWMNDLGVSLSDRKSVYYFVSNLRGTTYYAATKSQHERNKTRVSNENEDIRAGLHETSESAGTD